MYIGSLDWASLAAEEIIAFYEGVTAGMCGEDPPPPSQGDEPTLDALQRKGKGRGKDQGPRTPLERYGWFGKVRPQRLCPTPPGMAGKPGGKWHSKGQCTSKGGGKHAEPSKGKGKGFDSGKGYGKDFGKQGGKAFLWMAARP